MFRSLGSCSARSLRLLLLISVLLNSLLLLKVYHFSYSPTSPPIRPHLLRIDTRTNHNYTTPPLQTRQIIFVGGVPRSGTTLTRAMLDAHPDVHCGEETRVIPRILAMRSRWDNSEKEHRRLTEAGLDGDILDQATRAFISEIILGHASSAKFLCNKDPLVLNYMNDVLRLFPLGKFILMIRDGRAVAYSIVSRNVTISGVNNKNYMSAAAFWNKVMIRMTRDCNRLNRVGKRRCLMVYYEKLVQNPKEWMEKILTFLDVPWHENVLHHHELINKEVSLSRMELSSSQVKEPVNLGAMDKWRTKLPSDIQKSIYKECDMLKELGYPQT